MTEYYTNLFSYNYSIILSVISIIMAIAIITTKNPVESVLFLIGLFSTISLFLVFLNLKFMAIAYLLVYVGAISILFLFILMLINIRVSELFTEGNNSIILALTSIFILNYSINLELPYSSYILNFFSSYSDWLYNLYYYTVSNVYYDTILHSKFSSSKLEIVNNLHYNWDNLLMENNHISSIGNILYSNLLIFILLIAMILLLAMVGSIIITIKGKS